jgi:5'-3' exonuclease
MNKRFLDCSKMTIEEAESYGTGLAEQQRDVMFQLGDLARYAEARWPDNHYQVWPEWVSHGLIARAAGVARAYPNQADRLHDVTYTQYMQNAGRQDRHERLAAIVDKGLTSDESRKADWDERQRWLLAIDVHFYLHRFWYSGAELESAMSVASWVGRLVERLIEKQLTDVVCCFDSKRNHRKELVANAGWEDQYKDRPPKPEGLGHQLTLVRELLEKAGYCCVSQDGFEADDLLASFAKQFDGRVSISSADKDLRQCLSDECNMLLDVTWSEDETSGDMIPDYKWLSARSHTEATGIRPDQWAEYQAIMGDNVDGIKGVAGVGAKGAADLIKEFGTVEGVIQAAKDDHESIRPKKREALIDFEEKLAVTRRLVTLKTDLEIPTTTRI